MGYELNRVMETYGVKTPAEKVTSGSIYNQPQFGYTGPAGSQPADQTTSAARTTTGTSGTAAGGGSSPLGAMQAIASAGSGAGQMTGTDFVEKLKSMGMNDPSSGFADKYTVIGDTLFEKKFDPDTGRELAYQIRYDENDQPQIVYAGTPGGENIPSWASGATPGFTPTAERPGNKPSVKDLMDRGVSFEDASSLLYGVVGSNRDVRDWNAIMASNDPLTAARVATGQMYNADGRLSTVKTEPTFMWPEGKTYDMIGGAGGSALTSIPMNEAFARQGTTEQMLKNFGVSTGDVQSFLSANKARLDPYTQEILSGYKGPEIQGQFIYSPEYITALKPASEWDAAAAQRGYARGGEVQAYQQGGRQGDGITVRPIYDNRLLEGAASAIDRARAAERDVAPITIEDPFARENDLRALLEAYAPQTDYSGRLAEAEARRKAEFDAFANMIAGQADPEADKASKAEMYFRLAAAFGSPTKTGAFGENLALAAGEMADVSAGRRKSLAERAARQAELQKLRYQMAGEEVSALRSAQAGETDAQRRLAETLLKDSIASVRPQSAAGKIAADMGLQMGTPEYAAFVEDYTKVQLEKELAALQAQQAAATRMPASMIDMKQQTENNITALSQALESIGQAYELNPKSYSGSFIDIAQFGPLSTLGSDAEKVVNTRRIKNLLTEQALGRLKQIFGGNPTEGENKILREIQGVDALSLKEREEIMLNIYDQIDQRLNIERRRLNEITSGAYGVYDTPAQGE